MNWEIETLGKTFQWFLRCDSITRSHSTAQWANYCKRTMLTPKCAQSLTRRVLYHCESVIHTNGTSWNRCRLMICIGLDNYLITCNKIYCTVLISYHTGVRVYLVMRVCREDCLQVPRVSRVGAQRVSTQAGGLAAVCACWSSHSGRRYPFLRYCNARIIQSLKST